MFDEEVMLQVGRILTLMSELPDQREEPHEGDLQGNFDWWFDGGAVKHDTGLSTYHFADGAKAITGTSLALGVSIELPDGRIIVVSERKNDGEQAYYDEPKP